MNQVETALFLAFATLWVALFSLYHFMIFAVNRRLPADQRIPHVRIYSGGLWGSHGFQWRTVTSEYNRLYPRSFIRYATVACITSLVAISIAFVVLRVWEYTHARLP